jgi:hypothetical protein
MRCSKLVPSLMILGAAHLQGATGDLGVQAALVAPISPDLKVTAGSAGASVGAHGTFPAPGLSDQSFLRLRADYAWFPGKTQTAAGTALAQSIETKVTALSLGFDYLYRFDGPWYLFSAGFGLYETHWGVRSTDTLAPALGGTLSMTGSDHWWRGSFGPVATYRISRHVELEGRVMLSRYDQQNFNANTASLGLVWNF